MGTGAQVLPGGAKLRVAGAVQDEVESKVGGLQHVGDHQCQLKARRVVVTHDVVAEIEHLGRRHQNEEEDDDRHECPRQTTALLASGLAGHHARGCSNDGPVLTLNAARLTQRLH